MSASDGGTGRTPRDAHRNRRDAGDDVRVAAVVAVLQLGDALLSGLSGYRVRMNRDQSRYDLINLGLNLASVGQLVAWGGLAPIPVVARTGIRPSAIGLGRLRWRADVLGGIGLAALTGIPGLLLYLAARHLGLNAEVEPSALHARGGGFRC